ncbi:MAG: glycosyltransferase [Solirubrobacterales bacterium]
MPRTSKRTPLLYLAPWVDFGGTDKNTIDWFRSIDRERFAPYLLTTQASPNRRIAEISGLAEEIWVLPDLMPGEDMPRFILDFIVARQIEVVHIMNARLGFDLLPDVHCLPEPPGIVVQLHVEEADRSGYVRYVTTRYGNLVDRFSVTSEHLAAAVEGYGVPDDKIAVVYIGVDGEEEFSPEDVEPEPLDRDRLQILFPARVVQQKDPLLMVRVARELRDHGVDFQVHVLGEGDLEPAVRDKVREYGLGDRVLLHPPTPTPQRWYAAADAVLLTSEFEGVPAVVYEAMAMGVPIVAAALPGNVELLGDDHDGLVEPRDAVEGYAEALARLAVDGGHREARGRELRERALERFTLRQMAAGHEALYDAVAAGADRTGAERATEPLPEPLRFYGRPPASARPLVSVLVPHYNQARVLSQCIDSIRAQTYPAVELIVVDDCSTEAATAELLDRLEGEPDTTVVRLERNGGPSRARNRGVELCQGRYVLPVDADNLLMPEAIENLVEQLSEAGEEIGFVYPRIQYFGNRQELYVPPEYNVYTLLHGNFIDACSLIDREVFDAGLRYSEEIVLGHEDWEFALRLAAHGVRGELARVPTLRYRKLGFNRSDTVDYGGVRFAQILAATSLFRGHELEVKSAESPALSIACVAPLVAGPERAAIAARLAAQTSIDVELIAPLAGEWPAAASVPLLRPLDPTAEPVEALRLARETMRGNTFVLSADPRLELLADPAFAELVMRRFAVSEDAPDAIAFLDAGADARHPFRALAAEEVDPLAVHAIAWRVSTEASLPHGLQSVADRVVHGVAELFSAVGARIEWRHAPAGEAAPATITDEPWAPVPPPGPKAKGSSLVMPLLPGAGTYNVPRWDHLDSWVPPQSTNLLIRYRRDHDEAFVAIAGGAPEDEYQLDRHLGTLRESGFEGTARLILGDGGYFTMAREEWRPPAEGELEIGYVELFPFPGMVQLVVGVHKRTEQRLLVTPPDDPLLEDVLLEKHLGFIEPFPIQPRISAPAGPPDGLRGLVKTIDLGARRHRYALGRVPEGELVGELGAITTVKPGGTTPIWILDDRLVTAEHVPPGPDPSAHLSARWIAEPVNWGGLADRRSRLRSIGRRSVMAGARRLRGGPAATVPARPPDGYLFTGPRHGYAPVFAGYHPITGDQLLVHSADDIVRLGYDGPYELGYVRSIAPVTGTNRQGLPQIPWAHRFGAVPRNG